MKGRKPAINPDVVVEAVLHFKDRVISKDNGEKVSENYNLILIILRIIGIPMHLHIWRALIFSLNLMYL